MKGFAEDYIGHRLKRVKEALIEIDLLIESLINEPAVEDDSQVVK